MGEQRVKRAASPRAVSVQRLAYPKLRGLLRNLPQAKRGTPSAAGKLCYVPLGCPFTKRFLK